MNILFPIILLLPFRFTNTAKIDVKRTKIWGPGLYPDKIVMPARYFLIQTVDTNGESLTASPGDIFKVVWKGVSPIGHSCRISLNKLDINDGTFIIRYKLYHSCENSELHILYNNEHVADSPYKFPGVIQPEDCACPNEHFDDWFNQYKCKSSHMQIKEDLELFPLVDFDKLRPLVLEKLNNPSSTSFCNYVIKQNEIYRTCYGAHTGFKKFMDSILLSLTRKVKMPDIEFFINLGDWPLILKEKNFIPLPMFSWCGNNESFDIVLPTYDITESSLENMGGVMLDMLSVQSHSGKIPWNMKIEKLFWRGRDARRERLTLIDIGRKHPELFNVSLTNFFFFPNEQDRYGPKTKHVSFFDFFEYKYQLNIDGTVAAYRFPYLLVGNSLVFKQDSNYYEFFYRDLKPMKHYIPVAANLSDLVDKLKWAMNNDNEALNISNEGQRYARENLLPHDIFCYHALLFKEWSRRIISKVEVLPDMEHVPQKEQNEMYCNCLSNFKDEL